MILTLSQVRRKRTPAQLLTTVQPLAALSLRSEGFISSLYSTERVLRGSPRPALGASALHCQPWPAPRASRRGGRGNPPPRRSSAFLKKPGRPGTEGKERTSPRTPFSLCLGFIFLLDFHFKLLSDHRHQPQGTAACPGDHPSSHSRTEPCCPHSRERSPTQGGAILTKGPLRPLLNRNAIGTGRL